MVPPAPLRQRLRHPRVRAQQPRPAQHRPDRLHPGAQGRGGGRGRASSESEVPADAVTASGSGLDPHISSAYAELQARARRRSQRPLARRGRAADRGEHPGRGWASSASPASTCWSSTSRWRRRWGRLSACADPADRGSAARLPRRRTRRGQDLRHARRGPASRRAGHRPGRRLRRDPRPAEDRAQLEGLEVVPRAKVAYRGTVQEEMDLKAILARGPRRGPGRRARPHQRAGQRPREALAGRRGAARRGHRGHHHRQHPAPRVAQRRDRADHRGAAARDRPGPRGAVGRPDRAGRHEPPGAAAPDGPRQHLHRRQDRRGAVALLPRGQPHRAARAGPPLARRPRRRGPRALSRAARDRLHVGHPRAHRRRRSAEGRSRPRSCDGQRGSPAAGPAGSGRRCTSRAGRPHRDRARPADPARRQGRGPRRHLPHRRRRRPGRRRSSPSPAPRTPPRS